MGEAWSYMLNGAARCRDAVVPEAVVARPNLGAAPMIAQPSILLALLMLVDRLPLPPGGRRRGRPPVYPDRLFLKALVVMVVRRVPTVHALLALSSSRPPRCSRCAGC